MDEALARQCWARASQEELGIVITLADPTDIRRAQAMLYKVQREAMNPTWAEIMLILPGDAPKEIMMIRKTTDMSDVPYETPTE